MKTPSLQQNLEPESGPQAHEDFTLAQQLRQRRVPAEDGDGCEAFRFEDGSLLRVPVEALARFVRDHGPLHAGDYAAQYGHDWRDDFRLLAE